LPRKNIVFPEGKRIPNHPCERKKYFPVRKKVFSVRKKTVFREKKIFSVRKKSIFTVEEKNGSHFIALLSIKFEDSAY